MSSFSRLEWKTPPQLFLSSPNPNYPTLFTDDGRLGSSSVVSPPFSSDKGPSPIKSDLQEIEGSAQFKEFFAVVIVLGMISVSFNLFSSSLYVINLLPNLVDAHIRPDSNSITPLMIQAQPY